MSFFAVLFRVLDLNPPNMDPLILMASHSASDIDLKSAGVNKKDRTLVCFYWTANEYQLISNS